MTTPTEWNYQSVWSFFGLPTEYKQHVYTIIFDLVHHSGFSMDELKDIPIAERDFYYQKLIDLNEKKKKAMEKGKR